MKYKLVIQAEAEEEALEAFLYYEDQSEGLGNIFLNQLTKYLTPIQENPKHYQIRKNKYRAAFIKKFPYLIIYELLKNKVIIYSIFNTHRNPENKL